MVYFEVLLCLEVKVFTGAIEVFTLEHPKVKLQVQESLVGRTSLDTHCSGLGPCN